MSYIPRVRLHSNPRFEVQQALYAVHRIATFPVKIDEKGKRPAVGNYLKMGLPASGALAQRFGDFEALGFACGRRNKITVLDIDTSDENALADAMARHGQSPIVVRTASGKFHVWYRHAGERRRIRPWRDRPIDILGGGFAVAPPSRSSAGRYEFIAGGLDDVGRLPAMVNIGNAEIAASARTDSGRRIGRGRRNDELFRCALRHARYSDNLDVLIDCVRTDNDTTCVEPLTDGEVVGIAKSAWKYQQEGRNFAGSGGITMFGNLEVDDLVTYPDACALMMLIRRQHNPGSVFALANGMVMKLEWTLRRFRRARAYLVSSGYIACVDSGGRGKRSPPLFQMIPSLARFDRQHD